MGYSYRSTFGKIEGDYQLKRNKILFFVILFFLAGCIGKQQSITIEAPKVNIVTPTVSLIYPTASLAAPQVFVKTPEVSEDSSLLGFNMLIRKTGEVSLRREYQQKYYPVTVGTFLKFGDLISPAVDTEAYVLCGDSTIEIIKKESSIPCNFKSPTYLYDNEVILRPRNTFSLKNLPYIVEPRSSLLYQASFNIRWNPTGSNKYHVAIYNTDGVSGRNLIWEQDVINSNELYFSDKDGSINSQYVYWIEVVDENNKSSREDPTSSIGFRLLQQNEQEKVLLVIDSINSISITDSEKAIVLAAYFFSHGLYYDALRELSNVSITNPTPALYFWRARVMDAIALPIDDVMKEYEKALEEAGKAGDIEMQASSHAFLWKLTRDAKNYDGAIELYKLLNDQITIDALTKTK